MRTLYGCHKDAESYPIDITDAEAAGSLDGDRADVCDRCSRRAGTGPVTCKRCRPPIWSSRTGTFDATLRTAPALRAAHAMSRRAYARLMDIDTLFALGARVGDTLVARAETIAVAESSAGGLISAALLARTGAARPTTGGAVLYTRRSRRLLTTLTSDDIAGMRSSSLPYALLARHQRARFRATWGLAETGAAGPKEHLRRSTRPHVHGGRWTSDQRAHAAHRPGRPAAEHDRLRDGGARTAGGHRRRFGGS